MIRILNLTPANNSLAGNYKSGDIVLCKCDSSDGAFTVTLPNSENADNTVFIFKKIDTSENIISFSGINGQTINDKTSLSLLHYGQSAKIISDGNNYHAFGNDGLVGSKIRIWYDYSTGERGVQILLINNTGAASVKGTVVRADTTDDNSFILAPANSDEPFGVVYNSGIADSLETWIWIGGKVQVLLQDSTASTRGYWVRTSLTVAGRADATNADPPGAGIPELDRHMCEFGHCLESKIAGTNVLCFVNIHFN
jgi:hypothetical protein